MTRNAVLQGLFFVIFSQSAACASSELHDALVLANDRETASLPCRFSSSQTGFDRLTWAKDGSNFIVRIRDCKDTKVSSCNVSFSGAIEKFSVGGNLGSGVNLHVSQVTLADDGIYECKAILVDGLLNERIRLAVLRPPTDITLLDVDKNLTVKNMDVLYVVINHHNQLNCTVPSANPPASIDWSFGDVTSHVFDQTNQSVAANDDPLMMSTRAIDILPTANDKGKMISCTATHYGLPNVLRINVTLSVGNLPDNPTAVAVVQTSVTVNSFTLTWLQGSSGGNEKTYNVRYCAVSLPGRCSEVSGIGPTRVKIDNLRPFTLYHVEVRSHNVYGFSEGNDIVEQSTKPLSPSKLGIISEYNARDKTVQISRPDTTLDPLPPSLCFQLVDTRSENLADAGTGGSDCVQVGEGIPIPSGWSSKKIALVSYGNNVYSEPSKILGTDQGRTGLIIGLVISGVIIIAVIVILYRRKRNQANKPTQWARRQLPPQPKTTNENSEQDKTETSSSAKYHEVGQDLSDPSYKANALYHSYEEGAQRVAEGSTCEKDDKEYSSKITKTKVPAELDKYTYTYSPNAR